MKDVMYLYHIGGWIGGNYRFYYQGKHYFVNFTDFNYAGFSFEEYKGCDSDHGHKDYFTSMRLIRHGVPCDLRESPIKVPYNEKWLDGEDEDYSSKFITNVEPFLDNPKKIFRPPHWDKLRSIVVKDPNNPLIKEILVALDFTDDEIEEISEVRNLTYWRDLGILDPDKFYSLKYSELFDIFNKILNSNEEYLEFIKRSDVTVIEKIKETLDLLGIDVISNLWRDADLFKSDYSNGLDIRLNEDYFGKDHQLTFDFIGEKIISSINDYLSNHEHCIKLSATKFFHLKDEKDKTTSVIKLNEELLKL